MCGRFAITLPSDAMAQLFKAMPSNELPNVPNYNVCPTNPVHVIHHSDSDRRLVQMRWGFIPKWYKKPSGGPLLINARSETLAQLPAFAEACRTRRCLIPATGFFEWTKTQEGQRLPWYITHRDAAPLAFAGVWQSWGQGEQQQRTCAIVTTKANAQMQGLHHRVPVILGPQDWPLWLGEAGKGAARLMQPLADGALCFHRVGPAVNSNRASGPELIETISA